MAGDKSEEFELDEGFIEEEGTAAPAESDEDVAKTNAVKNSLTKRRVIDELLEERRLQKKLRDYDYDFDDDK